jgi:hypothetical protein
MARLMAQRKGWERVRCEVMMRTYQRMMWRVLRGTMKFLRITAHLQQQKALKPKRVWNNW